MSKLRIPRREIIVDYLGGSDVVIWVFIRGRPED